MADGGSEPCLRSNLCSGSASRRAPPLRGGSVSPALAGDRGGFSGSRGEAKAVSRLYRDPELREQPIEDVIFAALDEEGGPLILRHRSEDQRSFDSTCRKFLRFLKDGKKPQGQPDR